jgi:hypothetical protein
MLITSEDGMLTPLPRQSQGGFHPLNSFSLYLYAILAEDGPLMIWRRRHTSVEMCIGAFSMNSVDLVLRSCIQSMFNNHGHCWILMHVKRNMEKLVFLGASALQKLHISRLKESRIKFGRVTWGTRCRQQQELTI